MTPSETSSITSMLESQCRRTHAVKLPGCNTNMTEVVPERTDPTPAVSEAYALKGSADFAGYMAATRSAAAQAAFVRPHLRPGIAMLDCGCGLGSITVGL